MGHAIYCETKEATAPYIFVNTRIPVYSYEEVCYYIFHHPSMISYEILGSEFRQWVKEKLGMEALAEELGSLAEEEADLLSYLRCFLQAANYYSKQEVALFFEHVKEEAKLPKALQLKKQADSFLSFQKYVRAIRLYDAILKTEEMDQELTGSIYHNKGVALSKNFELTAASDCFLKAYECAPNDVTLSCYLTIFFLLQQYEKAQQECERLGVAKETYDRILFEYRQSEESYTSSEEWKKGEKLTEDVAYGQEKRAKDAAEQMILSWKEEYRRETT